MSTENQNGHVHIYETHCFKQFVTGALATFTGVYLALSLFCLMKRPPMPIPVVPLTPQPYMAPAMGHFDCPCRQGKMIKKFLKEHQELKSQFSKLMEED